MAESKSYNLNRQVPPRVRVGTIGKEIYRAFLDKV
jgi:hypothetical protein